MTGHGAARLASRDVFMAVGMVASLGFATLALEATQAGVFNLDRRVDAVVAGLRHSGLDGPMQMLSVLGQASALVPLIALASLLLLWRDRPRLALALPVAMAGTGLLQLVAKWAVDRPRPNGLPWGFPSGHALTVVVFFGLITYVVWTSSPRRGWRVVSCALSVGAVLGVAFSRLYLDMHWLSDVGGGIAVGAAYLPLVIWLVESRSLP